ncbi:MAG: polysaccharide deacetylase family protein [Bacteroidetes bacterium]|nr:polysaccharide deacetylase family protein [Bacteroidota bacterium]
MTPWVLETLAKYNAQATLFLVGKNAERYPDHVQRILSQGHAIGNHTYDHLNGFETSAANYRDNINQAAAIFPSSLFRPPYGKITPWQYRFLRSKYKVILWDVLSRDYDSQLNEKECIALVINKTRNGSIIVMHDSEKAKARLMGCLPAVLNYYSKRNFTFDKIEF